MELLTKRLGTVIMSLVDADEDHIVVLQAVLKYVPEDVGGAGLGDLYRVDRAHG